MGTLPPKLRRKVETLAKLSGMTTEAYIVRALEEYIEPLVAPLTESNNSTAKAGGRKPGAKGITRAQCDAVTRYRREHPKASIRAIGQRFDYAKGTVMRILAGEHPSQRDD
jgi:hypothetical protein